MTKKTKKTTPTTELDLVRVRFPPTQSPVQLDIPEGVERSVKGSLHVRPNSYVRITREEARYLKQERKDVSMEVLEPLGDPPSPPPAPVVPDDGGAAKKAADEAAAAKKAKAQKDLSDKNKQ